MPEEDSCIGSADIIALGYEHSASVSSTGRVFTWGNNGSGRLGLGEGVKSAVLIPTEITTLSLNLLDNSDDKIKSIALGQSHSAALTSSGKVFTWGLTQYGQLGLGDVDSDPHPTPTQITTFTTLVGPQEQITSIA